MIKKIKNRLLDFIMDPLGEGFIVIGFMLLFVFLVN